MIVNYQSIFKFNLNLPLDYIRSDVYCCIYVNFKFTILEEYWLCCSVVKQLRVGLK